MLRVPIKHDSSLHLVIPVLPFVYISRCGIYVLPTGVFVGLDCLRTWWEFHLIGFEKSITAFLLKRRRSRVVRAPDL